ncbi:MAG: acetylxylan esterase [Candidatus Hydrogenedentes bacterium]|nr:acetylxylan esterase [Candidatus Hydrogenedentota bacterium]
MLRMRELLTVVVAALVCMCAARAQDALRVLPEDIGGYAPGDMMRHYLIKRAYAAWDRWKADFEAVTAPEQIAAYQQRLHGKFVEMLGGFPERTPLNPRITGVLEREGYRVEKVVFESQPKLFVTGALFLPDPQRYPPPYPGVLVPCGHAENAKAHDTYQSMGALLALNGMVALVFDPIEQGERMQLLDAGGKHLMWGTKAHTMFGVGCILVGRSTARFEVWDGMRGIDYLQSRPEVDPQRIGCTGNSGGGTQTSFLMALDDRIVCAAPSCYLNHVTRQLEVATGDAEQNVYGQLVWGLDHADFVMMRAPSPVLIAAATKDFFDIRATWESFRFAKRRYTMMGFSERVDLLENDAEHNYNRLQRQGVVRWLARWLQHRDEPIAEPELELFTGEELQCTPRGQVMLLEGARITYAFNAEYEQQLAAARAKRWQEEGQTALLAEARALAGIRPLAELPEPRVEAAGEAVVAGRAGQKLILRPEEDILLPALFFPAAPGRTVAPALAVFEAGFAAAGAELETLLAGGGAVLAVDVRGSGETQQTGQKAFGVELGHDWEDYFAAYALGLSYVGMRAEDILVSARYLAAQAPGAPGLHAFGNAGVPALHAAALEPDLFGTVRLNGALRSWSEVVQTWPTHNQLINSVHGALTVYDLPDLARTLGGKLTVEAPAGPAPGSSA